MGMGLSVDNATIFWIQILSSAFVFTLIAVWYAWPALTKIPRNSALTLLLFVHVMRYSGLTTLVAGMIDPKLPRDFLSNAAYGDVLAAVLALSSIFALRSNTRAAIPLVWIFSAWGFFDMLNGLKSTFQLNVTSFDLRTFWYVYVFYAPLLVVTHVMIVLILVKSKSWKK